jgi:hypothetical protein
MFKILFLTILTHTSAELGLGAHFVFLNISIFVMLGLDMASRLYQNVSLDL